MTESPQTPYRVLARKYRPQNFDELIGQDALVRTLKNAIESGRIAHAFMLTGVRGVGKTTTARIIAKALNYKGPDGKAGPTTGATDDCQLCKAISEDRHPDVIEMDAASRTGVDDIREILDGVRYAPTEARYKIYIIDEVHMLSKNAFNALLKTLEEPPPHVKFIFATTEIRKVPVTVLSRCQRFDLRRVDIETLSAHYKNICKQEKVKAEDAAIAMIARAADGSVRDGLSILDQAIALSQGETITAAQVREMLGLGDRGRSMDLLEHALTGNMPEALAVLDDMNRSGADPVVLVQDLLDVTHRLTRARAVPEATAKSAGPDDDARTAAMAKNLSMPTLGKTWQILLKGLSEVQMAPNPHGAAEMVILRLAYAADLPDPADLIKKLQHEPQQTGPGPQSSARSNRDTAPVAMRSISGGGGAAKAALLSSPPDQAPESQPLNVTQKDPHYEKLIETLADVVECLYAAKEPLLASQVHQFVHLVKLAEGRLEIRPKPEASPRLAQDLAQKLGAATGQRWIVSISSAPGQPTLAEQDWAAQHADFAAVLALPVIKDILAVFPAAELVDIRNAQQED